MGREMNEANSRKTEMAIESRAADQWGHIAFLLASLLFIVWFLADAWGKSDSLENLMLIVPVAIISAVTAFFIIVTVLLKSRRSIESELLPPIDRRIPAFMLLVAAYVVGLIYTGFDLATFLFVLSGLWLLGERNIVVAVLYSASLTAVAVFGLREIISLPVPTLIFPR
jgi:putative tricarboxylic transport membrane protein